MENIKRICYNFLANLMKQSYLNDVYNKIQIIILTSEAVAAAWFFSQYDLNSRRKSREGKSRMKDHVWSRKEQNSVRNKLVEV